jgi:solute:Na+ symporter, SSS family
VRSAYAGMFATLPAIILTFAIGVCIYSYYTAFPALLPEGLIPDQWFPTFLVRELPVGITGLIIAGLLAATMSSADSGVNSLTTVFIVDIYRPLKRIRHMRRGNPTVFVNAVDTDNTELQLARKLSLAFGVAGTVGAMFVGNLGTVFEITNKMNGVIAGVLLGIFLAAVVSRRTNAQGVLLGAVIGAATIVYVAFGTGIYFMWYGPIGCLTTLLATHVFSRCFPSPDSSRINGLTIGGRTEPGDSA